MKRALGLLALLAACGGDPDPRVIAGGGVGDGPIDGPLYVFVISEDDAAIAGAQVAVGGEQKTTDATGFVQFDDRHGAQTIAVAAIRRTTWSRRTWATSAAPRARPATGRSSRAPARSR